MLKYEIATNDIPKNNLKICNPTRSEVPIRCKITKIDIGQVVGKKSPTSKFKYTFLLIYLFAQLATIFFYMGNVYEYLLLLALPASIILSRMLRFLPKYWMKEAGLWIIIICLMIFKVINNLQF